MGDENPIRTLGDYSKPSHEGYMNTIELPEGNNVLAIGLTVFQQDPSPHGRILLLVSLLNFFHREGLQNSAMTSLCSNNINESRLISRTYSKKSLIMASIFGSKSKSFMTMSIPSQDEPLTNRPVVHRPEPSPIETGALLATLERENVRTVKNPKLNVNFTTSVLSARSYPMEDPQCSSQIHSSINAITICPKQPNKPQNDESEGEDRKERSNPENIDTTPPSLHDPSILFITKKNDDSHEEGPKDEGSATIKGLELEYFDTFQTRSELAYHREDTNRGVSNFMGRIKGMHVFVGNFTYVLEFMIVEDISSIIDPRLTDEIAYKMPHKIEQYNSLSNLEKVHINSVNLRIEEDKRRGVEYVMSKILGINRECLELRPEYLTGVTDEDEVTKFLIKNEEEIFTVCGDGVGIKLDDVSYPAMLYLTRSNLEVLRKFHWTTLGGRSNQLSHVSSPLLSKPGEYWFLLLAFFSLYSFLRVLLRILGTMFNLSVGGNKP
ncbi:hypothetical protein Tco_0521000 [Tanacetum coccineum]